ncbi:MAG TPA: hypothetical protein VM537_27990, partial [Anaerolineae bacterium]|nr:hypothetical protein [Anaerolineae bacterium]
MEVPTAPRRRVCITLWTHCPTGAAGKPFVKLTMTCRLCDPPFLVLRPPLSPSLRKLLHQRPGVQP